MSAKDKILPVILALFALICAGIILIAVFAVRNINRSVTSSDWVNATHATINELAGLAAALEAGEGSFRLYALSGQPSDQAASRQAYVDMADHLEVLKAHARNDATRLDRVLRLETAAEERAAFARKVMTARTAGQLETMQSLLTSDSATGSLSSIYREIDKLKTETMALLADRDQDAYLQAQATRWTVWAGVTINFLLLAGTAVLIYRNIALRARAAAALEQANANLEAKVIERTAEISAANTKLTTQNLERHWTNQALEHQLYYDRLIINSISDLVFVLTKIGNISRINPAVTQLSGWTIHDLVNRPLTDILRITVKDTEVHAFTANPIVNAMQDGHSLRDLHASIRNRLDHETSVALTFFPLRDGTKIVGGIAVLRAVARRVG